MQHRPRHEPKPHQGQFPFIDEAPRDWHLDETTVEVGRRGIAAAREALAKAAQAPKHERRRAA